MANAANAAIGTPAAAHVIDDGTLSAFFETMAVLMDAGIQIDEALSMLAEDAAGTLKATYGSMYEQVAAGHTLAKAMEASGAFPAYATTLVTQGTTMGRLHETLMSLARYYGDQERILTRIKTSLGYPAALLCGMSLVLAFTVIGVLPVFINVYENLSGSLTEGSFSQVTLALTVGWVVLVVTVIAAVAALWVASLARNSKGHDKLMHLLERIPPTQEAAYGLALSRMVAGLSTNISSGTNVDEAVAAAAAGTSHPVLHLRTTQAHKLMIASDDPQGLVPALVAAQVIDPVYGRLLGITVRSGGIDESLEALSEDLARESMDSLLATIDGVEPLLSAFLTVAVGATLLAIMLPLVGIMASLA